MARAALLALAAFLATNSSTSARDTEQAAGHLDAQFDGHLAAGEFAPALRLADEHKDAATRDGLLARVAAAQRDGGAARAAAVTAGRIGDERLRADVYANVASLHPYASQAAAQAGAQGGGNEPDFEAILDLVKSTVAPQSWDDVGGAGSAKGFANGVYVDPQGVLHRLQRKDGGATLVALRNAALPASDLTAGDVRRTSHLRKISLPRLERALAECVATGRAPDDAMRHLAGIHRIECILVYPETGDLVIAGPAGAWRRDGEDRVVNSETRRPVIQLDDLVVVLRHVLGKDDAVFGCTIDPTDEGLAATKRYVDETGKKPLPAGDRAREKWVTGLRSALGQQDIEVFGIDPRTRVARVLVEADYRMKLVGLGLEDGVLGVPGYLDSIRVEKDGRVPPLDVLRWWFTLDYDSVQATPDGLAYKIVGQGTRVLSENQFLEATGKRQGTGKSTPANAEFARNFTKNFAALAEKYPVYAELQNLCDMALAAAVIKTENLRDRTGLRLDWLLDSGAYQVGTSIAPAKVDTVAAHRVLGGKHVVAAISGGVRIDAVRFTSTPTPPDRVMTTAQREKLSAQRRSAAPTESRKESWWWD